MRHRRRTIALTAVLFAGFAPVRAATAAPDARPLTTTDVTRLEADLARVQQEVREQRQLILQLMQMHDALLRYVQLGSGGGGVPVPATPPGGMGAPATTPAKASEASSPAAPAPLGNRGSITGKVRASGNVADTFIYVDGPKSLARSSSVEIKQLGRQFVPAVAVVQVGARVLFPNEDKVFHNVFSRTPGDAFDLGTLKAGDRPSPVVLLKPGHVEVFCNIHSKMRADVLVVPNGYWTRVRADGSFQLSGVPVGTHRVVLWGPAIKPVSQRVELTAAGASVTFAADAAARRPHLNKQGGAYESYEE